MLAGLPLCSLRRESRQAIRVESDGQEHLPQGIVPARTAGQHDLPGGGQGRSGEQQAHSRLAGRRAEHQRRDSRKRPPHDAMLARGEGPGNVSLVSEPVGARW
jgi:hypothetical protein